MDSVGIFPLMLWMYTVQNCGLFWETPYSPKVRTMQVGCLWSYRQTPKLALNWEGFLQDRSESSKQRIFFSKHPGILSGCKFPGRWTKWGKHLFQGFGAKAREKQTSMKNCPKPFPLARGFPEFLSADSDTHAASLPLLFGPLCSCFQGARKDRTPPMCIHRGSCWRMLAPGWPARTYTHPLPKTTEPVRWARQTRLCVLVLPSFLCSELRFLH